MAKSATSFGGVFASECPGCHNKEAQGKAKCPECGAMHRVNGTAGFEKEPVKKPVEVATGSASRKTIKKGAHKNEAEKPVKREHKKVTEPVKTDTTSGKSQGSGSSTIGSEKISLLSQDKGLDDLVARGSAGEVAQTVAGSALPPPVKDDSTRDMYKKMVYPLAVCVGAITDMVCKPFGFGFCPVSQEQAATLEGPFVNVASRIMDKWLPQWAKDHPDETALIMLGSAIAAQNFRKIESKPVTAPAKAVVEQQKQVEPVINSPVKEQIEVKVAV